MRFFVILINILKFFSANSGYQKFLWTSKNNKKYQG